MTCLSGEHVEPIRDRRTPDVRGEAAADTVDVCLPRRRRRGVPGRGQFAADPHLLLRGDAGQRQPELIDVADDVAPDLERRAGVHGVVHVAAEHDGARHDDGRETRPPGTITEPHGRGSQGMVRSRCLNRA